MKSWAKQAFTLIEMLLVIVIILVLGVMLYPAYNKVRESGRSVRCSSNLRQLHLAAINVSSDGYTPSSNTYWWQDSDGGWYLRRGWITWYTWTGYPSDGPRPTKPADGAYDWQDAVANQGTRCITNGALWGYAKNKDIYLCPSHKMKPGTSKAVRSYAMNAALSYQNFFQVRSSMQILFGDDANIQSSPYDGQFATNEVATWHSKGKGNVVYLDGHVEQQ